MGKSLSNTDQNFLTDLKAGGIDCIYVRTRMDEIKSSDEKVPDTVNNDQKQLKELIEADPVIFHISNESGNDWYHEIDQLRAYLLNSFIGKLKDQNEIMVDKRLLLLAEVYQKRLESLKNSARTCLEGQTAEIDRQKCELSRLKEELNNRVQEKDRNLRKKINIS